MRRRQWIGLAGSFGGLAILFAFYGTVILVTLIIGALFTASVAALIFDKREDDVNKNIDKDVPR